MYDLYMEVLGVWILGSGERYLKTQRMVAVVYKWRGRTVGGMVGWMGQAPELKGLGTSHSATAAVLRSAVVIVGGVEVGP